MATSFDLCRPSSGQNMYKNLNSGVQTSWLHRASNNVETFLLPTDAHNVKKHRVIKTF